MGKLDGKVGIVTGAGHGMGAAHALALGREGASVAAVDVCHDLPTSLAPMATEEELNKVVDDIKAMGRRAIAIKCDVRKADEVEAMVKRVVDEFGKVDILVANAGVVSLAPVADMTVEQWNLVIDVNLTGVFLCTHFVLPLMLKQNYGRIVLIGSIWGREGGAGAAHYAATKAGVHMLAKTLGMELVDKDITVNALAPITVMTPMMKAANVIQGPMMGTTPEGAYRTLRAMYYSKGDEVTPEDIANLMLWLVSDDARKVSGQTIWQ